MSDSLDSSDYFDTANAELDSHLEMTTPIKCTNPHKMIFNLGRETKLEQFLRELWMNSFESGAEKIVIGPYWPDVERLNVYRFSIGDNGCGMSEDDIRKNYNLSETGEKIFNLGENFGIGAKIACLPWNLNGMLVMSWKNGVGKAARIWFDPNKKIFGFRRFAVGDAYYEFIDPPYKPDYIKDHGTLIVLLGNNDADDTWQGPIRDGDRALPGVYSHLSTLNNRFYRIPKNVEVLVQTMKSDRKDWPKSEKEANKESEENKEEVDTTEDPKSDDPKSHLLRGDGKRYVKGLEFYLKKSIKKYGGESGVISHKDFDIHWYWIDSGRSNIPYVMQGCILGSLFNDEIYDIYRHAHAASEMARFGIYRRTVAKNVAIIIEPKTKDLFSDSARSRLIIRGYNGLPWDIYGSYFAENMPQVIKDAQDNVSKETDNEDFNKTLKEEIKPYLSLMKTDYIHKGKGVNFKKGEGNEVGKEGGQGNGNGGGNSGNSRPRRSTPAKIGGDEEGKLKKHIPGLPEVRWVKGEEEGLQGRIARYDYLNNVLLYNIDFEIPNLEVSRRLSDFGGNSDAQKTVAQKILQKVANGVYAQKLAYMIAHHRQNRNTSFWTQDQWLSALSPEALTAAVLGFKWAENLINRIAGPQLTKLIGGK